MIVQAINQDNGRNSSKNVQMKMGRAYIHVKFNHVKFKTSFFGDQEASKITVFFIHNYRCNKVGQDDFLPVMKQVLEVLCTKPEKVR